MAQELGGGARDAAEWVVKIRLTADLVREIELMDRATVLARLAADAKLNGMDFLADVYVASVHRVAAELKGHKDV